MYPLGHKVSDTSSMGITKGDNEARMVEKQRRLVIDLDNGNGSIIAIL